LSFCEDYRVLASKGKKEKKEGRRQEVAFCVSEARIRPGIVMALSSTTGAANDLTTCKNVS